MHRFSYAYIGFDLLLLLAAFMAINASWRGALWSSFFLGVLRDLGSVGRLGSGALALLLPVLLIGIVRERYYRDVMLSDILFSFVFLFSFGVIYSIPVLFLSRGASVAYLAHAACRSAFSVLLVPPFFGMLHMAGIVDKQKTTF